MRKASNFRFTTNFFETHALTRTCCFSRNVKQLSLFGDSFLCEKSFPSISVRSSTLANSKKIRITFQFLNTSKFRGNKDFRLFCDFADSRRRKNFKHITEFNRTLANAIFWMKTNSFHFKNCQFWAFVGVFIPGVVSLMRKINLERALLTGNSSWKSFSIEFLQWNQSKRNVYSWIANKSST